MAAVAFVKNVSVPPFALRPEVSALFVIVAVAAVDESRKSVAPPVLKAALPASFVIVAEPAVANWENLNRPPNASIVAPPMLVRATFAPTLELLVKSM